MIAAHPGIHEKEGAIFNPCHAADMAPSLRVRAVVHGLRHPQSEPTGRVELPLHPYQGYVLPLSPGGLVTWMVPESQEPLVGLEELPVTPESPGSHLPPGYHQRPCATAMWNHGVPVKRSAKPYRTCMQFVNTLRTIVPVASVQHQRDEPPGMIMVSAIIVRSQPVVQAHRSYRGFHIPPDDIRAPGQSKLLMPSDPYGAGESNHPPPLHLSGALTVS